MFTVVVMNDLGQGGQAVSGARGVADHLHVGGVLVLVDPHHKHGSIC